MIDKEAVTLYVDLDGTLTPSDLLVESTFALIRKNPLIVMAFPLWLFRGRAHFKRQVASRIDLDIPSIPWTAKFLDFLEDKKRAGTRIVLITASDQKYADAVADHLEIFDHAIGSNGTKNLSGFHKLQRILEDCGNQGFDYSGNAITDMKIWLEATNAYIVNPYPGVIWNTRKYTNIARVFLPRTDLLVAFVQSIRAHHWLKNLLIFMPLLFAHRISEGQLLFQAGMGFISFCLCTSGVYLLNDLFDLESDRHHSIKRKRAIPSGRFPPGLAMAASPLLIGSGFLVALPLAVEYHLWLLIYVVAALLYCIRLKQIAIADVLVLNGFYLIRLMAGGAAVAIPVSSWLLAFSLFLFLSLGLLKRFNEIQNTSSDADDYTQRPYRSGNVDALFRTGVVAGILSVAVLAIYAFSEQATVHYSAPWLICPILVYWLGRAWLKAYRGRLVEDPVVFVLTDHVSIFLVGLSLGILWYAISS